MRFLYETDVALPIETVFRFHESPANLPRLVEGWPGFAMLRNDGDIRVGSRTWVLQSIALGVPVAMGFRHTAYEPPLRFEEEMFHGPYRSFVHTHEFEEVEGGTRVRDRLSVTLPWCYGGELALRVAIAPWMRRFFAYRHHRLAALVESGELGRA